MKRLGVMLVAIVAIACGEEAAKSSVDAGLDGNADAFVSDLPPLEADAQPDSGADGDAGDDSAPDLDIVNGDAGLLDTAGCTPQCNGKVCGPNGCGSVCGFCKSGEVCAPDGSKCAPFCQKQCTDKVCGDDGCGGQCGTCDKGFYCGTGGKCFADSCVGSCDGKNCGDNGCGKSCGECATGDYCDAGQCKAGPCKGVDLQKGQCDGDLLISCTGTGATAVKNVQDCAATAGNTCGWVPAKSAYACIVKVCDNTCVNDKGAKMVCGTNGCGKSCGTCQEGWKCNVTSCDPAPGATCNASNFPAAGKCLGNTWIYCNTGKLKYIDCVVDAGMSGCGWNEANKQFECQ